MNERCEDERADGSPPVHGSCVSSTQRVRCWRRDRRVAIMSIGPPGLAGELLRERRIYSIPPDNAVVDFTPLEAGPSDHFQYGPVLLQIAAGLALRLERRLQDACLPGWSDRQNEGDTLACGHFGLRGAIRILFTRYSPMQEYRLDRSARSIVGSQWRRPCGTATRPGVRLFAERQTAPATLDFPAGGQDNGRSSVAG